MARPRVFVSSTFYDLKHIRSSLDLFIESLGFDSILSEKGDIAYAHEVPLDESCYREVSTADIFVLIVGHRYGSPTSREEEPNQTFYDRYESVTKKEHEEAVKKDIPIFILVEASVYTEYRTYLRNKTSKDVQYAHVDSINVFRLLEQILSRGRNNPVQPFERFSDIENWLREQWAGLFREHLQRKAGEMQLRALSDQVNVLQDVTKTLQRYLEEVVSKVSPGGAAKLIETEQARLSVMESQKRLRDNRFVDYVMDMAKLPFEVVEKSLADATSFFDFAERIGKSANRPELGIELRTILSGYKDACDEINAARKMIGKTAFKWARGERADAKKTQGRGEASQDGVDENIHR